MTNYHIEEWCTQAQHLQEVAMSAVTMHAILEAAITAALPMAQSMQQYRIHAQSTVVPTVQTYGSTQYTISHVKTPSVYKSLAK